jgi:hypothetical protein
MAECRTCIHFDDCLGAFRSAQALCIYDDCTEDEYFSDAGSCTYYADKSRFIEVPVKPGDTVYNIHRGKIKEWKVYFVGMNSLGEFTFNIADEDLQNSRSVWDREIGETIFLNEEDAINELKERKWK